MPYLAVILFLPWFLLLGSLYWLFPRQPRSARRQGFDLTVLAVAFVLSFVGMQWGYGLGAAEVGTGAIWKQVLATLVAYGAFLFVLIAVPIIIQSYGIFAVTFLAARRLKLPFEIAAPACLIGTSNFFELAVAVAITLFGLDSGAALATVVGVLVEVPVMLSVVRIVNASKPWYERRA